MAEIRIYTTPTCGYCMAALALLRNKRVPYENVNVAGDSKTREWLVQATGQRTVPQIFIDGRSVGGYSELSSLDRRGELDAMLAGVST
jgi:glutaredoxin 3